MTIQLTITAETPEQFAYKARVLLLIAAASADAPVAEPQGSDTPDPVEDAPVAEPQGSDTPDPVEDAPAAEPENPKRTRRTKAEIAAEKKAEAEAKYETSDEPDVENATGTTAPAEAGKVDLAQIRKAGMEVLAKRGNAEGMKVIEGVYKAVGATKTSELPEDKYAEVLAALTAALEG